ncbi:bacteriohemerythrin [Thermogladius calderae]|uniref:bacteriohemerythrin n=1 Tax=Thermogladius calderae TaxID=1200300 RepID=UPI001389BD89|nr:hemerythrin family protein [Thermogladius calderae]
MSVEELVQFYEISLRKLVKTQNTELIEHIVNEEPNTLLVVKQSGHTAYMLSTDDKVLVEGLSEELCSEGLKELMVYNARPPFTSHEQLFALGLRVLDEVHTEMFRLIRDVFDKIVEGDIEGAGRDLQALVDHTRNRHFKLEEALMVKYGYFRYDKHSYDSHLKRHAEFLDALSDVISNYRRKNYRDFLIDFMGFVDEYLRYMSSDDKKLVVYLTKVCGTGCTV